ncbi:uncharacterized protein ASCRUDRAFT_74251 [Ascoidea rubescens DSM 1968]|uniref:Uncharacterized protein n=1 Tax=Ascoidea rubescens DSM 1968 TaxID=1344418 RepID=A0A1D2VME5_9ASCO|nr:hypothetical protein ASCRUDRAFT_74251 [Ascoidea rubescens DSM 1968]ODV62780.1 hypothetical protein ASCRUDRAFT_74251 [Ascoidea rubescens DSM 1968]
MDEENRSGLQCEKIKHWFVTDLIVRSLTLGLNATLQIQSKHSPDLVMIPPTTLYTIF